MSDSSEEEDLSKFKEAVDNTFTKLIDVTKARTNAGEKQYKTDFLQEQKPLSERYLETSAHYNDVKVPEKLQKQIGEKISAIIHKNIEFVQSDMKVKIRKVKGGVKLFKNSEGYLCCEEPIDNYTENHNKKSKVLKNIQKRNEGDSMDENEKINASIITGNYILSKAEIKSWKSRRKEKLFKYKSQGNSKVLLEVE